MGLLFKAVDETRAASQSVIAHLNKIEEGVNSLARAAPKLNETSRHVTGLGNAISQTARHVASLDDSMQRVIGFVAFRAAVGAVRDVLGGLSDSVKDAVKAASDTGESMNKVDVVFGSAADSVKRFASTAATDLGLSQRAALEATGTFGNLFVAMGFGDKQTAEMSKNLLMLAADLASFNNISTDEALVKLRAGLVGEQEPLRTLGVNLTEATIEAKALSLGLMAQGDTLTAAGKALAVYELAFEQTKTAQGDFARTSQGWANQLRTLSGNFDDLKASAGEALLPLATDGVRALNSFMGEMKRLQSEGLTPLDAGLKTAAASLRTNFGEDAARAFEGITGAVGRAAEGVNSGKQSIFQALGGVGEEIGTMVKRDWGPAFIEWAGPAKDRLGTELRKVWDEQLSPWISQTGLDLGKEANDKWIPAFVEWTKGDGKKALRPGLDAMAEDAKEWSKTEGAQLMRDIGGNLAWAMLDAFDKYAKENVKNPIERAIGDLAKGKISVGGLPAPASMAPTGATTPGMTEEETQRLRRSQFNPDVLDRQAAILADFAQRREEAAARIAAADKEAADAEAELQRQLAAANTPGATGRGGQPPTSISPPPKPPAVVKPPEHVVTAIEGFMAELARDAPRWEKAFGDVGSKVMLSLGDAIESGTGSAGASVAKALQDLKRQAEQSGVQDWATLGDELAGSLHDALINRGNPALRAAAMENLRSYTEAIKAANALTAATFAKAFDVEGAKAALGSGGRAVMAALETAIKEGGVKNIEALAGSVAGMKQALFEDRDLSPDQARAQWGRIFEAVNTAIDDGGAEAQAALAQFFRDLNFEQMTMKVSASMVKQIEDAEKELVKQVNTARENAGKQIQQAINSLNESRALRGARENVDKTQAEELKNVVEQVDRARQAWHDYREQQHTDSGRAREDADLERSRAQEDADIMNRRRTSGVTAGLGGGMSEFIRQQYLAAGQNIGRDPAADPSRQANLEARALAERRNREDAERARKRGEQDADRTKALTERAEDAEKEKGFAGIIDAFRRTQAEELRGFLDRQENIALEVQKGRIHDEEAEAIAAATRVRDDVAIKATQQHDTDMARIALQREAWGTVPDLYIEKIKEAQKLLENLPGGKGENAAPIPDPLSIPGAVPKLEPVGPIKGEGGQGGININVTYQQNGTIVGVPGGMNAIVDDIIVPRLIQGLEGVNIATGGAAG